MAKIEFHPNAKQNFDDKANALLLELKPIVVTKAQPEFSPDFVPSAVIRGSDIIGRPTFKAGNETKFFLGPDKQEIGLSGEAFRQFSVLVDQLYRNPACRERVSDSAIEAHIFKWMEERYFGTHDGQLIDYLASKLESLISQRIVYVPVAATAIESEIQIGKVRLAPLTSDIVDSWQRVCPPKDEETRKKTETLFSRKRKELQGYAVGILEVEAEPGHAKNVAVELVEQVLSFLRVFSPVNADVRLANYTRVKGRESIESVETIVVGGGNILLSESIVSPQPHQWLISSRTMNLMMSAGLGTISGLLAKNELNPFQQKILNALTIYSKSSLEHDPEAKLIYIFSSLETLLLKNESEPIQQNVGERIAFLTSQDRVARRRVIQNVKEVYALRSKFFHHGHGIEELESISEFMRSAWSAIMAVISHAENFETKEQFIAALEDLKLS